jgi:hypothetical protein
LLQIQDEEGPARERHARPTEQQSPAVAATRRRARVSPRRQTLPERGPQAHRPQRPPGPRRSHDDGRPWSLDVRTAARLVVIPRTNQHPFQQEPNTHKQQFRINNFPNSNKPSVAR